MIFHALPQGMVPTARHCHTKKIGFYKQAAAACDGKHWLMADTWNEKTN